MKNLRKSILFNILLLFIFVIWSINVSLQSKFIQNFDWFNISRIYHHSQFSILIFRFITSLGNTDTTIVVTIIFFLILIWKRYNYAAIFLVINKISIALSNTIIKQIVHRQRPLHHHYVYAGGFSYPSGHSASSFALLITILIIALFVLKKLSSKLIVATITIALVLAIGYSRIFLGVHYPSDVVGGYLLAATITTFWLIIFRTKDLFILKLKGVNN